MSSNIIFVSCEVGKGVISYKSWVLGWRNPKMVSQDLLDKWLLWRRWLDSNTSIIEKNSVGFPLSRTINSPSYKCCLIKKTIMLPFPQMMLSQPILKLLNNFIKWDGCIMPDTANVTYIIFPPNTLKAKAVFRRNNILQNDFHIQNY